jgi:hypothetical protein
LEVSLEQQIQEIEKHILSIEAASDMTNHPLPFERFSTMSIALSVISSNPG